MSPQHLHLVGGCFAGGIAGGAAARLRQLYRALRVSNLNEVFGLYRRAEDISRFEERPATRAALLAATFLTAPALAADLYTKARPAPVVVPLWSWTGFTLVQAGPATNLVSPLGGFQVGYNYQLPNAPVVIGIDGDFADLNGDHQNTTSLGAGTTECIGFLFRCIPVGSTFTTVDLHERFSSKVKDTATITGRIGVTSGPQDRTLWYVKGGAAWAKTTYADSRTFSFS